MKRFFLILLLALALAGTAAALWGNHLVAAALDAELAPLLTRQLGLPVQLAPIEARALSLRARSAKLVMGDQADPAVVATDVNVRLSWPELLRGNVRLVYTGADDLMVKPSRWPQNGKPAPSNYRFLEPWLPRRLQFHTGRYVSAEGDSYPVEAAAWGRRLTGGVGLSWSERRKGGRAELEAELTSLDDLLDLRDFKLYLRGAIDGTPQSDFALALHIQPDDDHAYQIDGTLKAIDATLTTHATGSHRWALPDASSSRYDHLEPGALGEFLGLYDASGAGDAPEAFLATPLPALNLVPHTGSLYIDEIRVGDEIVRDAKMTFVADRQGLRVDPLSLQGPRSGLDGYVTIRSSAEGWDAMLNATLLAHAGGSIGQMFEGTDWIWESGNAHLKGRGKTWGDLLYSLVGNIAAQGFHRGKSTTPITVAAALASNTESFSFEHLKIALGEGHLEGSALLSGTDQRKLTLNLTGENLDLNFLLEKEDSRGNPGVAIPEYLQSLPGLELDWTLDVTDLHAPALTLASANARVERYQDRGKLVVQARGHNGGALNLSFEADNPGKKAGRYALQTTFDRVDLPAMFQQPGLLHSRTSGSLQFEGGGEDLQEIFTRMHGTTAVAVEVRADNNWQRHARDDEKLELRGTGSLVIDSKNIVGVTIENLNIDSSEQNLTGNISMVATRSPWLIASLESQKLDINGLRRLLPESTEEADRADFLQSARQLGAAQISLKVATLTVGNAPISQLDLTLSSKKDLFRIEKLALFSNGSRLESTGEIAWESTLANVELTTRLTDVNIDQFLIRDPTLEHEDVSGTARVKSAGSTVGELMGNLTGHIELRSTELQPGTGEPNRVLLMTARRLSDGIQADVENLRLGESHLAGSLRYTRGTPPQWNIEIDSGSLSLLPWESGYTKGKKPGDAGKKTSGIRRVATASASAVGRVLTAPLRLFQASDKHGKPRMFSDKPLPFDSLRKINLNFKGRLESLQSSLATVQQLSFEGRLKDGALDVAAQAGNLNAGKAQLDLQLDASAVPPSLALNADFDKVRGLSNDNTFTRSGATFLTARGQSTAALAASLDGLVYLELGPGLWDYQSTALLSESLASQVFGILIPGIEQQQPQLECGVSVAEFTEGKGVTPFGFALRTNRANLLGHLKINLAKEEMQLDFASRSRKGVGLSLGNMISNSVQVSGSLTNPSIMPRTTNLVLRGWAAVMTGGLSVLGETFFNRVLASENPCTPIRKQISSELCPRSVIAASSARICPVKQAPDPAGGTRRHP